VSLPLISPWVLVLAIFVTAAAVLRLGRRRRSRRGRRVARRGLRAEVEAEIVLERHGYRILDRQVAAPWPMRVDGEELEAGLRADLVVGRRGRVFIAEVKTGAASRVTLPETRRQLLEYRVAFDCDGVLLVDMEEERVHRVEFPLLE